MLRFFDRYRDRVEAFLFPFAGGFLAGALVIYLRYM
jgi:hypothetical protein